VKVLTNSFYGYTGWAAARWYKRECADGTAAWGRNLIMQVVDKAKARGINVIYGDTDSLFVTNTPDIDKFAAEVNAELPLELDRQEEFESILFTGAKKRYAGLTKKGALVVKGLEVKRGDWCVLAQRIQEECLERVLRDRDPGAAATFVKATVTRLRAGDFTLDEVTINKGLTMSLASYKTKGAHVLAVERAIAENPGYKPQIGAKVSFVIVKPGAPEKSSSKAKVPSDSLLRDRARLVEFLKPGEEPDPEYYVEKQVVPAAVRILEQFGFDAESLRGGPAGGKAAPKKQPSLQDWF
jgi:DNA polymerase I